MTTIDVVNSLLGKWWEYKIAEESYIGVHIRIPQEKHLIVNKKKINSLTQNFVELAEISPSGFFKNICQELIALGLDPLEFDSYTPLQDNIFLEATFFVCQKANCESFSL